MIGIISDTHENVENIKKAVSLFKEKNVEFVIHIGDIISPPSVLLFEGLKVYFVKGNNDGEVEGLKKKAEEIGCKFYDAVFLTEYKGKKIIATHYPSEAERFISMKEYDYVLYGHDHVNCDKRINGTRLINPGAHYPGNGEGTVVLLDVENDKAEFVKLS